MNDLLTRLQAGTQIPEFELRQAAATEIRRLSEENDRLSQNLLDMGNEAFDKIRDRNNDQKAIDFDKLKINLEKSRRYDAFGKADKSGNYVLIDADYLDLLFDGVRV